MAFLNSWYKINFGTNKNKFWFKKINKGTIKFFYDIIKIILGTLSNKIMFNYNYKMVLKFYLMYKYKN